DSTLITGNNAAIVFPAATVSGFLSPRDEIGVFNQAGRLCGAGGFAGDNFAVTVWGDDASTADVVEGMAVGEPYKFMIWQVGEEAETPAVVEFISGSATYEVDDLAIVGSVALNPVKTADPASDIRVSIYPNPARDWVKVDISGSIGAIRAYQLMDMHGRIVQQYAAECDNRAGCAVTLPLPQLPSGPYLLRITGDTQTFDYRIIIGD
ncbi:MAG TPA: T9SS type A sorting domain-containing protein, partial [Flavilitoribacter sp.]|nr:T9SS type A sorting domain-containing protein [Flavilitoribacter sp.]